MLSGNDTVMDAPQYRLYNRRWLVLLLFALFCLANSIQWIQYAIISDKIQLYYGVEASAVNWTSMVWMLVYLVLIFPATWYYNKTGLRNAIVIGQALNTAAAWIKVGSVSPDLFWLTMIGQTVVAMAQVYVLSTPTAVAATWFGPQEVSTACAIGVFGLHFGNTLGFLIPPSIVTGETVEEIGQDLSIMFYSVAIFNTVLLVLIFIFIKEAPPTPPSAAQANKEVMDETPREFLVAVLRLFQRRNFVLLFFAYGIQMGVFSAFLTYINPMILEQYPDGQTAARNVGVTLMVCGMIGALSIGYFLDRTRAYKGSCVMLYVLAMVALVAYTLLLEYTSMVFVFISVGFMGFFMISYFPAGYEFCAELTYPETESVTTCVVAFGTQIISFLLTLLYGNLIETPGGTFLSNWVMVGFEVLGIAITAFIPSDLRRQKAERDAKKSFISVDPAAS